MQSIQELPFNRSQPADERDEGTWKVVGELRSRDQNQSFVPSPRQQLRESIQVVYFTQMHSVQSSLLAVLDGDKLAKAHVQLARRSLRESRHRKEPQIHSQNHVHSHTGRSAHDHE
jgi:hypothetical protein